MLAPSFLKIFVADLDRAQAFYGAAFGLAEVARFAAPTFDERILSPGETGETGGLALVLCQRRDGQPLNLGDAYGPIGFRVQDLEARHVAVLAAGGVQVVAPRAVGPGRVSLVADLDGHLLELLALP